MQILEQFQGAGEGIGWWGLVLRTCAIKYSKEGFAWVFRVLGRHWLVRAGSSSSAIKYGKEGFAWVLMCWKGIGWWGLVLRTCATKLKEKVCFGFWVLGRHWLVRLVLRTCAIKYGKEGFVWVFVWGKCLLC